jgi:sec-independent protein translocase protein TatB
VFDIGWTELLVIGVVAVVVVGPKDLPRMMRMAGQWMGRGRTMAAQFRRSFDDMARHSELEELRAEVKRQRESTAAELARATDIGQIPHGPLRAELVTRAESRASPAAAEGAAAETPQSSLPPRSGAL